MDCRRKSIVAKADPAQPKAFITEWLFPRLEIGLLHARITENMSLCMALYDHRDIIRNMSSKKGINRMAFCLLAGIPHLWLRLHTIRVTDLLINLNTKYCLCGKSTRARDDSVASLSGWKGQNYTAS